MVWDVLERVVVNTLLVGQALSFLKDNDITVDHDNVDEDAITEELNKLRNKRRVDNDPFKDVPHH